MNEYSKDYAHQCAAWTLNPLGRYRKQCSLTVAHNIDGWIYLCGRHYEVIEREFERRIDNLNSQRVENMQRRLDALWHYERILNEEPAPDFTIEAQEQRQRAQTVYFIRCEQYVKIGMSHNPTNRLRQIKAGGGSLFPPRMDLTHAELIQTEPGGFIREKELHTKFAHLRHTGEWFTEAPELTDYITSLQEIPA